MTVPPDDPKARLSTALTHKRLAEMHAFWDLARDGKPLPTQSDLKLWEVAHLAPNAWIMDVLNDTTFRYRFIGTDIDRHVGRSMTGKTLGEVRSGATLANLTRLFGLSATRRWIGYYEAQMGTESNAYMLYRRLSMPVSDDGKRVNKLFGGWYYERADGVLPVEPLTAPADLEEEGFSKMVFFDLTGRPVQP